MMTALKDRRVVTAIGAGVALLLAILIGLYVTRDRGGEAPAQALQGGGLQIEQGAADNRAASTKPLRCFVNGQFIGMELVADCAKKNGVAAQALDVGLDPATGQVTAASGTLAPPVQAAPASRPIQAAPEPTTEPKLAQTAAASGPPGDCMRYTGEGWRGAGVGVSLGQCARMLFDGRCERAGDAIYGRWGPMTLRLVPGRVEISPDNRNFRPLVPQNPQDCSLPPG